MDIKELLNLISEIDADEILGHVGDKNKLEKASFVIMMAQEGMLREFSEKEVHDVIVDTHGDFFNATWGFVLESIRENRWEEACKVLPMFNHNLIADLIWDERICAIKNAKDAFESLAEAYIHG